jgi:Family of unknown function (DUF5985)
MTGAALLYLLCLLASIACAGLLLRAFRRTRAPLLLWSAACFALLALNNLFVVADMLVFHGTDLTYLRQASAFAAVAVLLYGFIWEVE